MVTSISTSDRLRAACRDEATTLNRASEHEADARSRLLALALLERQARDDQLLASGKLNYRDLMLFGHVDMSKDVKVDLLQGLKR